MNESGCAKLIQSTECSDSKLRSIHRDQNFEILKFTHKRGISTEQMAVYPRGEGTPLPTHHPFGARTLVSAATKTNSPPTGSSSYGPAKTVEDWWVIYLWLSTINHEKSIPNKCHLGSNVLRRGRGLVEVQTPDIMRQQSATELLMLKNGTKIQQVCQQNATGQA